MLGGPALTRPAGRRSVLPAGRLRGADGPDARRTVLHARCARNPHGYTAAMTAESVPPITTR